MEILRPHLQRYWQEIVGAVLAVIVAAVTALWQPHLLQAVLNAILTNDGVLVKRYGIELIVVALIGILAGVANVFFAARLAQGVTSDLREETYRKIQTFSFGNIEHFSSGSLVVRLINDMNQITNFVMTLVMQLIRVPVLFVGSFILGVVTIPRLWWVEVSLITIIVLVAYFIFKRMGALFERVQTYMDKVNLQVKEELQGIRVVKSFNQEGKQQADFNQTSEQLNQVDLVIGYLFSASFPAFTLVSYLGVALAIYLVAQTVTIHPQEIAALSAYITYLTILTMAIIIGGMTSMAFSRGLVSLGRIKEVLATKPDVEFEQSGFKGKLQGNVTFKEVSFAYPDAKEGDLSLADISFQVQAGQMIGIVGATGAGKSTLAQLIARLYDPTAGTIEIDGHDLKTLSEETLRQTVSFVLQKALLFSGTIESNLKQGKYDATSEELERAIGIAQAAEFVNRYQEGLGHEIEERSANLSGGQKQRLSIARGVVGQPPILILDDSTSALDAKSEKLVQEALAKHLQNTTTFIIAEKIVSVLKADQILVLDQGRLVAKGTHQELLASSPLYQEIYASQKAKERMVAVDD